MDPDARNLYLIASGLVTFSAIAAAMGPFWERQMRQFPTATIYQRAAWSRRSGAWGVLLLGLGTASAATYVQWPWEPWRVLAVALIFASGPFTLLALFRMWCPRAPY